MHLKLWILLLGFFTILSCKAQHGEGYIFFLHNRFLEEHSLQDVHPEFGKTEYHKIISAFEEENFVVISEIRQGNVNAREYALEVKEQIDSLLLMGVPPNSITVIGTSKGGYIAQYVSSISENPNLNFVFIGSYRDSDMVDIPEINFCGNILTIYEKTDEFGVSAIERKQTSRLPIPHFAEIELNTGLKHGFLFKPLKEWLVPSIKWAKQHYTLE